MNQGSQNYGRDPYLTEMRDWVIAASAWGKASQSLVGAAGTLALSSRSLADVIEASGSGEDHAGHRLHRALPGDLRLLGEEVESDTKELRDRFLATEANLAEYRQIIG